MPKRKVPIQASLLLLLNGKQGLFAIGLMLIGWFFAKGTITTFDYMEVIYLSGEVELGKGEVEEIFETGLTLSDEPIVQYNYVFHSPDGDLYWTSYDMGYWYNEGDPVVIEYNKDRPDVNRIQGMSNTMGGIVLLIPLLGGLVWMGRNMSKGRKQLKLIKKGGLASGKLTKKKVTGEKENNRVVYRLTFSFSSTSGEKHKLMVASANRDLFDKSIERAIVYQQSNPKEAILLESLPWSIGKTIVKRWQSNDT